MILPILRAVSASGIRFKPDIGHQTGTLALHRTYKLESRGPFFIVVGLGQLTSPPAPMMPPASGRPVSTRRRMVIADCRSVPATPDKFPEKRPLGRLLIEVKRLRI